MMQKPIQVVLFLFVFLSISNVWSEDLTKDWNTELISMENTGNSIQSSDKKLVDEVLFVRASSASVLQWFRFIEKQKGVSISYNPSNVDSEKNCIVPQSATMTISQLLSILLKNYKFSLTEMPGRKIVIRIDSKNEYMVSGIISDNTTSERLYGAMVAITDSEGKRYYTVSNENGIFYQELTEGAYNLEVSYMGFEKYSTSLHLYGEKSVNIKLNPMLFEVGEVTVQSMRNEVELSEITSSGMLSFNGNDLFSQIWILPGVTGIPTGNNFMVNGGSYDENIILLDGVPVFHPGHISAQLPQFCGDAIKNIVFHNGFFPIRLEGGLSSVTEFNLKDGNKNEHLRIFSIDMPAASLTLEGPFIKNKLSYLFSIRRSWMDFFDQLLSEQNKQNHYSLDFNAKLSYYLSPTSSIKLLAYNTYDEFRIPIYTEEAIPVVKWNNQIYKLSYNGQWGKLGNVTSAYYSAYSSRANADVLGYGSDNEESTDGGWDAELGDEWNGNESANSEIVDNEIGNGIKTFNLSTEFSYSPENIYSVRLGAKYTHERYEMAAFGGTRQKQAEAINQYSVYYDNYLRLSDKISTRVGVHFVAYSPVNYRNYYSIQPRFALNYTPDNNNMLYLNFSKMEQFYHYISFNGFALPTDFRMPSIEGFKPRSSEHYEVGWKNNFAGNKGKIETSVYYKTRRNLVALGPSAVVVDNDWSKYMITGKGDSYGIKFFLYYMYDRWTFQQSYTYSRSREWFNGLEHLGKLPSLYDIPHYSASALSYKLNKSSAFSLGCIMKSGRIQVEDNWLEEDKKIGFRTDRGKFNYRLDVGYTFKKEFDNKLLVLRCGLYNVLGNPPEEDIIDFYSVHISKNCFPYGSISFKF